MITVYENGEPVFDSTPLLVIAAVVVLAVLWFRRQKAKAERELGLAEWAERHGWHHADERPDLIGRFSGPPFDYPGHEVSARNVVSATYRGHEILAYEYHVHWSAEVASEWLGSRAQTRPGAYRIAAVETPIHTPRVEIERRWRTDGVKAAGLYPLMLGHHGFDQAFAVFTDDHAFTRTLLTPQVMEWLLASGPPISLRLTGTHLLAWNAGEFDPGSVQRFADLLADVLPLLPRRL